MKEEYFMQKALEEAKKAYNEGEVPIGCVIVKDDEIIGKGYNRRAKFNCTTAHAEMIAIKNACENLLDWRLEDCTIYTTVEPCVMCSGAIIQARAKRLVYGTANEKFGAAGSITNLFEIDGFNHKVEVTKGIMQEECSFIMKHFFKKIRKSIDTDK